MEDSQIPFSKTHESSWYSKIFIQVFFFSIYVSICVTVLGLCYILTVASICDENLLFCCIIYLILILKILIIPTFL